MISYFSAAISAESIHSEYDVPELVSQAEMPPGRHPCRTWGAWNDHPLTIQAIAERAERMIRTTAESPAVLVSEA